MRNFKFYKENERWYVDLPEWSGTQADLEMVAGADTFLDILSQGDDVIHVTMSQTPFDGCESIKFLRLGSLEGFELGEGGWYFLNEYQGVSYCLELWLCDVTKFVFGELPAQIFFR
jgi:hypothetical protein